MVVQRKRRNSYIHPNCPFGRSRERFRPLFVSFRATRLGQLILFFSLLIIFSVAIGLPVFSEDPPTCNGMTATVWVDSNGIIHGGDFDNENFADKGYQLKGTDGDDVIVGPAWADNYIDGLKGNDCVCTGAGNDYIQLSDGDDWVQSGAGDDHIQTGPGDDCVNSGPGNDYVETDDGQDCITDPDGGEYMQCGAGIDEYNFDPSEVDEWQQCEVLVSGCPCGSSQITCTSPPSAIDDAATTDENNSVNIDITVNDIAIDGAINKTTVTITRDPQDGSLGVNSSTGVVSYTPDPGFCGSDYFMYTVDDNYGMTSNEATVTVTVVCNESPQAGDDGATTDENTSVGIDVTANDTDSDGTIDRTTVTITKNPEDGSVSVHPTSGVVTYTPNLGSCGSDTFKYTIDDNDGATSNEAMVTVNVLCNDPPLAIDDLYSMSEGGTLDIPVPGILANDVDTPGSLLTAILISNAEHGTLSLNTDGSFTYIHDGSETSGDSFTYKANDGAKDSNAASVSIVINPTNDPPMARDDDAATDEDVPVIIDVLTNDSDPDGDTLSVDWVSQPANGTASNNGSDVTYTPGPDFYGTDTFTYTASDGNGGTATAMVTVFVATVNDPPLAQDDSDATDEDVPVIIDVLMNDSDPDGDALSVDWVTQPPNGTVSNNSSNVTYTADAGFGGIDTFSYTVADGKGGTSTARVVVAVSIVNDPPVAQDDSAATNEDTLVTIPLLANDSDPDGDFLLVESFTQPAHGSVLNTRNAVSYIPDAGFNGIDKFSYTVSDGNGGTATATVTVSVAAVNDLPVAQDDSDITDEGTPVIIPVLLNDSDPDGDTLVVESVMQSENGTVSNDGTDVTYTPEAGFSGIDIFDYTISDGKGGTDTATIIVAVASVNDPPVAQNDSAAADKDTPVTISVLANDSDPDADPLRVESVTQPANGTLANNGFDLLYTPDEGFTGSDTFTYTVSDGRGSTDTATVTVGVSGEVGGGGAEDEVPCDGKVIISEVAWAGTASDPRDEWIELRNLGPTPVDLSGWVLRWLRTHPSTADDQIWKVVELSGILLPAAVSAFDRALQDTTPAVRFLKENPEDVSWLVLSELDETDDGYYIVERRHDDTVSDVAADLLYDTSQSLSLELSDLGEVIMLVNNLGEVVDTANASYLGRNGWAAGSATTYSTMERVDPLGADVANNWHTNMGIAIHGVDARKRALRATPRGPNSPVLEDLYLNADIELTTVRSGEVLTVDFLLPKQDRRMAGWPWISVARPGFAGLAGAGGAADQASYSFSGRSEGGDHYVLDIGTKNLPPGEYVFWVIYGQGKAILVPIVVTP